MKKTVLFLTMLALLIFSGTAYAETVDRVVDLKVGDANALIDNQPVQMSSPAVVVDGRTLVPLRFVGEAFGCNVDWKDATQTATLTMGGQKIEVTIGKTAALVNGDNTPLQVPAQLISERTYVPLRFVGESLGADVTWNDSKQQILIKLTVYANEKLQFKTVLPSSFTLKEETEKSVYFEGSGISLCYVENLGTFDKIGFDALVNETMKGYLAKDKAEKISGDNFEGAVFLEDGLIQIPVLKFVNGNAFLIMGAFPKESFNEVLGGKYDIIFNTVSAL